MCKPKANELVRFAEVPPCFGKLTKLILKYRRANCYIIGHFFGKNGEKCKKSVKKALRVRKNA